MTQRRWPSASSILAFIALTVALGGTALAATGQLVNIADPGDSSRVAEVDAQGNLSIGGTVNARELPPRTPMHFSGGINLGDSFEKLASAPSGKALVIKSLDLNTYANPTPGQAQNVQFYIGPTGSGPLAPIVAQVNPPGLGLSPVDVGSGIIVPNGSSLWVDGNGSVQGLAFGFGFIVAAASVPAMTYVTPSS